MSSGVIRPIPIRFQVSPPSFVAFSQVLPPQDSPQVEDSHAASLKKWSDHVDALNSQLMTVVSQRNMAISQAKQLKEQRDVAISQAKECKLHHQDLTDASVMVVLKRKAEELEERANQLEARQVEQIEKYRAKRDLYKSQRDDLASKLDVSILQVNELKSNLESQANQFNQQLRDYQAESQRFVHFRKMCKTKHRLTGSERKRRKLMEKKRLEPIAAINNRS